MLMTVWAQASLFLLAAAQGQAEEKARKEGLSLELTAPNDARTIDVFQIRVRLKNTSSGTIVLTETPNPRGGLSIEVCPPDAEEYKEASTGHGAHAGVLGLHPEVPLKPGECYQTTLYISAALTEAGPFALPSTGKLKVRAIFDDVPSKRRIVSEVATVKLVSSESLDERVRLLFGTVEWHRFATGGGGTEKTAKPFAEFFASATPFHQRHFLALLLGQSYQYGSPVVKEVERRDPVTGAVVGTEKVGTNEPNSAFAIAALRDACDARDSDIKARALHRLAECYLGLRNVEAGLHCLSQLPFNECDTDLQKECLKLAEVLKELKERLEEKKKDN